MPVAVTLVLAWALVADSIAALAGVIPVTLVCAFRVARSRQRIADRWYEIALGGGALVAVGIARAAVACSLTWLAR